MTDFVNSSAASSDAEPHSPAGFSSKTGAGDLLRQNREAAGLHIEALASALKVTRAKLEALESDSYQDLPDIVFARALAMSCCRYLSLDSEPVLSRMPGHDAQPSPGLRQHQLGAVMPRPSFGPFRGPFASHKVPPWLLWAFVLAVIVVGGWFAASPQRVAIRAPAPSLDFPPPGVAGTDGATPAVISGSIDGAAPASTGIAIVPNASGAQPASPAVPAIRLEPVTPSTR